MATPRIAIPRIVMPTKVLKSRSDAEDAVAYREGL